MAKQRALALVLVLVLVLALGLAGQSRLPLSIDMVMQGPQFYGYAPQDVRWSGDNQRIYFRWKQTTDAQDKPFDTWMLPRASGNARKLSEEEAKLAPPISAVLTRDRKKATYTQDGDIFVYDYSIDKPTQLTKTADTEKDPHFTQDGQRVAFTRGSNLYVMPIAGSLIEQLTAILPPGAPEDRKPADPKTSQGTLQIQEDNVLDAVRDRNRRRDADEAKKKKEHPRQPFRLEAKQSVLSLQLCPNAKCVLALIEDGAKDAKNQDVPNYVTESSYPAMISGRTNVGDAQENNRVAVIDVESGEAKYVDAGLGPRSAWQYMPVFNQQGTRAVMLARANDNKDRWVLSLDISTAKATSIFTDHDDAWIDGPGYETLDWLKNGQDVYFVSERDGYAHLYTVPATGGPFRQITSGKWEVASVDVSNDGSKFYLTTSETGPAERHFYSTSVTGGQRTRITTLPGKHDVVLSRDEDTIADVHSYVNRPPEIYTGPNRPGAPEEPRTASPSAEFKQYQWLDAPIVQVPARDGAMIPARLFKPANFQRGGPAVVFVHGAGYLQNVHKYWSPNYPREFLFHHFLMEHGYMVLDLDYRASAGYGRDWRTAIYRHMGGKDLDDNVDGAKWLVSQHGVDPKRIGIYGGSYGGFITLMAMFTTPDVFAAGAALRPVTDWSHYNHGYTSNILNTPQADDEAFKKSSPIFFAGGLKGSLLILHGMVDTNVFFQDTVRLTQRLIELRKENWSVAMYPAEDHAFVRPESWADEYKRIFKLFEENLK
ncbi:MAG: prolyl oligopeptidase family serine peptidase [Acidobacteriota bacterium]